MERPDQVLVEGRAVEAPGSHVRQQRQEMGRDRVGKLLIGQRALVVANVRVRLPWSWPV
jgi:hypothetical protein